ncbi:MAG: pyruvate:ferredoxin (flavodoxin) oxidoreductase [Gammaproteobacteria bacterium]|nr:pyruvate:ferredoxin (flavodoxin) oxidoreductase [Gammaproteobacteria bacterium]
MSESRTLIIDGNEAAARIAYLASEVVAIYPITPASPMGELADQWAAEGRLNLWGRVPRVVEMQSEGGAAGAVHGALQAGALTTTFTASQGLLLMIPDMYRIAGELTPAVFHVAARSLAAQALSIFGDHSDVMAARATGFSMLSSGSVQEAMDLALVAHAATLAARIPVVHFFDGFRTSHEQNTVHAIPLGVVRSLLDEEQVRAHRRRALSPDHPVIRGTAQNPDVYFQARETVNPYYERFPGVVQHTMDRLQALTGRAYRLFDYRGAPDAERVLVVMGSGAEAAEEAVRWLAARGEWVGVVKVRLYRPFAADHLIAALPPTVRRIAVLDRSKEPGAGGEPLYKDVVTAVAQYVAAGGSRFAAMPRIVGGRYGLSSKEFTPAMVKAVLDDLAAPQPRNDFTVGIHDDVGHHSLSWDPEFVTDAHDGQVQAVFYGLGSDGTVSANKNTIKIIGEDTAHHGQGYFVYDSKKSGAVTVSHLRFGPRPIASPYLIGDGQADFVACHQPVLLERLDVLAKAAPGAVFLLNSPVPPEQAWDGLPRGMQERMIRLGVRFHVIDAYGTAQAAGLGRRINTVMQACFFALAGVLPRDEAVARIKAAVQKSYGARGEALVDANFAAIDGALAGLHQVPLPAAATGPERLSGPIPAAAPDFVRDVIGPIIAGRGDDLPVSRLPVDGTWPTGTAAWEKRNLAPEIPVWDADLCTHCGKCPLVCPHAAIRSKVFPAAAAAGAPATFKHVPVKGKDFPADMDISYQVAPEDCTGCGLCVEVCPISSKEKAEHKALNMAPQPPLRAAEAANWAFFLGLPEYDRRAIKWATIKGCQLARPLFEFSGACIGCGETPYLKLATQLFGDRMLVANATGCSSIYGGNLPTTPWTVDGAGRGPAWSNSLFEDNAEFGFGFRLAVDSLAARARGLVEGLANRLPAGLAAAVLEATQGDEAGIQDQRQRVAGLRRALADVDGPEARELEQLADYLVKKSVWIVGGDGWAYDIGFGGLDHVLAQDDDVNVLVLDTEVYSNTGGQMSKATPKGAVARFAAAGKPGAKKDLALMAMAYGHVYVATVALGGRDVQTVRAFLEAESYPGPSLILAYSPCLAHGIDLGRTLERQDLAVRSGHWPLLRFDPRRAQAGGNPLQLDSKAPELPYEAFTATENRFRTPPGQSAAAAARLAREAQQVVLDRYRRYRQFATALGRGPDEDGDAP